MNDDDKAGATPPNGRRKLLLALLIGLFLAAGIGYGIYWALVGRYVESTDDAYVGGNLVQITPQVSGTVLAIDADNTDYVRPARRWSRWTRPIRALRLRRPRLRWRAACAR